VDIGTISCCLVCWANGTLDLRVAEQDLHGTQVTCLLIDDGCLGSPRAVTPNSTTSRAGSISPSRHLAGEDAEGEFVVARLVTTNPRQKSTQQAMTQVVHDVLRTAIASEQRPYWRHRYVLIEPFDRQDYLKTDFRVLEAQRTLDRS
jgi:hypothetical protein